MKETQKRFGDHCYDIASAFGETKIDDNIDGCSDQGGHLWWPDSPAELKFILHAFATDSNTFHLGYKQMEENIGILHADNSFGLGVGFHTRNQKISLIKRLCTSIFDT